MKIKSILATACALTVVTGAAFGTIAFLTDRDEVNNTFTVGDVQISVEETDVTEVVAPCRSKVIQEVIVDLSFALSMLARMTVKSNSLPMEIVSGFIVEARAVTYQNTVKRSTRVGVEA